MPPTYPFRATALMKYKSAPGGPAFSFGAGETVRVVAAADDEGDWLEGENERGDRGVFPSSFVKALEEEQSGPAESASARNDEVEDKARETVEATPKDDTNVVEASESTPADEAGHGAESAPSPASPKADAAPANTITSPTLADVTPSPTAATDAPAKSASPPPPTKKLSGLASRIAAFNAAAAQQAPPPVAPKPKPRQWARPAAPAASSPPPADALPAPAPAPVAAPSEPAPATRSTDEAQTQTQRDFSAEDAQASISRGGGSLRDRIKALQGGLKMDQPPAPGRAPSKPWRKPSAEPEGAEENGEEEKQDEAEVLQDAVVKDERPREDETTAQSPGAEVPGFEPAEGSPFVPGSVAGDDDQEDIAPRGAPESGPTDAVKQESRAASIAAPAAVEDKEQDSTVSSVAAPVAPEEVGSAQDESTAPVDEDEEENKRANLATRMASLGGQRMGVPMPALPKRAAGPRARKAKAGAVSPAAVEVEEKALGEKDKPTEDPATTDEPVAPAGTDDAEASVVQPAQDEEQGQTGDVLASMGRGSALLSQNNDDEESHAKAPEVDDDDDFDSPAPPAPSQRSLPPRTEDAEPTRDAADSSTSAPPPPSSRPPLPPSFARQDQNESSEDLPDSGAAVRSPPAPARPLDPPAFSSGAEKIVDEPRPTAHAPEHEGTNGAPMSPPPLPKGRPPVPPAFQRQQTEQPAANEPAASPSLAEQEPESKDEDTPQHPPIPTHPAPLGEERVTTAAEDRVIAQMPEIVTPPEEAADESTASPTVNAPTTETIAQGRIEHGHEPADMGQPAWGKVEGTETPAVEMSPPALAPKTMMKEDTREKPAEQKEEEEEDEEEEDPEIARRRALAARMAKLGGRGPLMGGPMLGFGGLPPKKAAKKKPTSELAEQGDLNAAGGPKADEPVQRDNEESSPASPTRRPGDVVAGGFALPGIAPFRLPPRPEAEQQPQTAEEESEPLSTSSSSLAEKSAAATDEAFARTDEKRAEMQDDGVAHQEGGDGHEEPAAEEDEVPPPLPPSRPSTLPPRRSVPIPTEEQEHDEGAVETETEPVDVLGQSQQVGEPEAYGEEEPQDSEDEGDLPPPPPPPRPAGGHQSSLPLSPPLPPTRAVPASPPTHSAPNPSFVQQDDAELARTATQSSRKSSINPPRSSLDVPFEPARAQASGAPGAKPNLDALLQWSASLGAQVFAAAHTKMSDKGARGLADADLVNFCFSRATDPLPPVGAKYGVKVYDATVGQGKKAPMVDEDDEPRAGDVVAIAAKFKHNLSSKTVGSPEAPHVAIVAGWDAKKGKLRVIEVDGKNGTVDEGSYRIDEMRAGHIVVYRVAPNDFE